jgi:hypothetical protein
VRKFRISFTVAAAASFAVLFLAQVSNCARAPLPNQSQQADSADERAGMDGKRESKPAGPPRPTPRTPDGKPDLSGIWDGRGANINKDLPGKELPYTPDGAAAYQFNLTQAVDPQSLCIIIGQPRADVDGRPFEIVQNANRMAFLYERDASRRVIRLGSQHPSDPEPSFRQRGPSAQRCDTFDRAMVAARR